MGQFRRNNVRSFCEKSFFKQLSKKFEISIELFLNLK